MSKTFAVPSQAYANMLQLLVDTQFIEGGYFGSMPRFKGCMDGVTVVVTSTGPWGPQGFGVPNIDLNRFITGDTATRAEKRNLYLAEAQKADPTFTSGQASEFYHWVSAACRPNALDEQGRRLVHQRAGGARLFNQKPAATGSSTELAAVTARVTALAQSVEDLTSQLATLNDENEQLTAHNQELQAQLDAFIAQQDAAAIVKAAETSAEAILPIGEEQSTEIGEEQPAE